MNEAQADAVRGPTAPGSALEPVLLADGRLVLPLSVLDDPAHAQRHDRLVSYPIDEIGPEAFHE